MSGVFRNEQLRDVEVEHEGVKYVFKVRDLSWSGMNKVLSRCSSFTADRKGVFDLDLYYREALLAMVVETPMVEPFKGGPLTHQMLTSFTPEFGSKLEALVPVPGGASVEPPLVL